MTYQSNGSHYKHTFGWIDDDGEGGGGGTLPTYINQTETILADVVDTSDNIIGTCTVLIRVDAPANDHLTMVVRDFDVSVPPGEYDGVTFLKIVSDDLIDYRAKMKMFAEISLYFDYAFESCWLDLSSLEIRRKNGALFPVGDVSQENGTTRIFSTVYSRQIE